MYYEYKKYYRIRFNDELHFKLVANQMLNNELVFECDPEHRQIFLNAYTAFNKKDMYNYIKLFESIAEKNHLDIQEDSNE